MRFLGSSDFGVAAAFAGAALLTRGRGERRAGARAAVRTGLLKKLGLAGAAGSKRSHRSSRRVAGAPELLVRAPRGQPGGALLVSAPKDLDDLTGDSTSAQTSDTEEPSSRGSEEHNRPFLGSAVPTTEALELCELLSRQAACFDLADGESEPRDDESDMGSPEDPFSGIDALTLAMPRQSEDLTFVDLAFAELELLPCTSLELLLLQLPAGQSPMPQCYREGISWTSPKKPRISTGACSVDSVGTHAEAEAAAAAMELASPGRRLSWTSPRRVRVSLGARSADSVSTHGEAEAAAAAMELASPGRRLSWTTPRKVRASEVPWVPEAQAPVLLAVEQPEAHPELLGAVPELRRKLTIRRKLADGKLKPTDLQDSSTTNSGAVESEPLLAPEVHRDLISAVPELSQKLMRRRKLAEGPSPCKDAPLSGGNIDASLSARFGSAIPELRTKLARRRKLSEDPSAVA